MGRRKGTSAFPVARIKKMMQADDDVGKIATVTPVLVAKALECMMEYVLQEAANVAVERRTKTVTPQHLKACVMRNDSFDFLRGLFEDVENVDDRPSRDGRRRRRASDSNVSSNPVGRPKRPRSPTAPPQKQRRVTQNIDQVSTTPSVLPSLPPLQLPVEMPAPVKDAAADEDEEDYDEEEDDEEGEKDEMKSDGAAMDSKGAAERVSVHALLS